MDRKKVLHWAAIVGLATGVVALVSTLVALYGQFDASRRALELTRQQMQQEQIANERKLEQEQIANARKLEQQRIADEKRIEQILAAEREEKRQQEQARICEHHEENLDAIEARFSKLMDAHSLLLNSMKECTKKTKQDDVNGCLAIVCAGAYLFAGSNCVATGSELVSIGEDLKREIESTQTDNCTVPESSANRFLNG